jgi:hypothetical protein
MKKTCTNLKYHNRDRCYGTLLVVLILFIVASSAKAQITQFEYTGNQHSFTVPSTGLYKLEAWGAKGGDVTNDYTTRGGLGGYASGLVELTVGQIIYIYVGGKGENRLGNHPYPACTFVAGGWNGGGATYSAGNSTPGGGASDIRINGNSLSNRILVAGGGGGAGWYDGNGGNGGGINGADGTGSWVPISGKGGTQLAGGAAHQYYSYCNVNSAGSLGQGGNGSGNSAGGGGGGGGYYGGSGGFINAGGGGSSYIGGVTNGVTQMGIRNGDGLVRITSLNTTYYADVDGDGYGNPNISQVASTQPAGYVKQAGDCDDTRDNINPGAPEVCDGLDNDCNGQVDEGVKTIFYADADGDGFGNIQATIEACSVPVGYVSNPSDCNDADKTTYPGAPELCDGKDHNCDGKIQTPPSINYRSANSTVNGKKDGVIVVEATGAATLKYRLNGGAFQDSNEFTGLAPGIYSVTVQDGNGCSTTVSNIKLLEPPPVTPLALDDNAGSTCSGSALLINGTTLLSNDKAPYSPGTLKITATTQPAKGTLTNTGNGTYTYTPNPGSSGSDEFSYTVEREEQRTLIKNNANGHYYEMVPAPSGGISWLVARDAAAQRTYKGLVGYLVTITSQDENNFVVYNSGLKHYAWIGASDAVQEGIWRWVTGPLNEQIQLGKNSYSNWATSEPNDAFSGEDYGQIYGAITGPPMRVSGMICPIVILPFKGTL